MKTYVAIAGTWGWNDRDDPEAWFQPTSAFASVMRQLGYEPLRPKPFAWSTRINGDQAWRRLLAPVLPRALERSDLRDWEEAAENLGYYAAGADLVVAHSHGGQIVALAAAYHGFTVPRVVTVATPCRREQRNNYFRLHTSTSRWTHLYDRRSDWIAWLGQFGDGAFLGPRSMEFAHENIALDGIAHTGVLNDPAKLGLWRSEGWLS